MKRLQLVGALVLVTAMLAGTASASAQVNEPAMTVTPESGVRPVVVTVTGTPCGPVGGILPLSVRIVWQVEGNPPTQQIRIFAPEPGASWTTTLVLGVPNLGMNLISATCVGPNDLIVVTYPDKSVEVLPVAPVLAAAPTVITVGEAITATADRCPDPELPRLGGGYSVRFTLEYLIPAGGTEGPYVESITVGTDQDGSATTTFTLPTNAPTEGGAYRIRAMCELEELGSTIELFNYTAVAIQVSGVATPTPTPEPTATVLPTATPTAGPSATPTPNPTPQPTTTPAPTATVAPTATPWPTPTPTPRPGVIVFTG